MLPDALGILSSWFLMTSIAEFAFLDRQPADALSGRREDELLSAVSHGDSPSHGFCFAPRTAAHRLRDFAEFGSPRKFAAACASKRAHASRWSPQTKITRSEVIIAQRRTLAI
jgi:hypothetical protein